MPRPMAWNQDRYAQADGLDSVDVVTKQLQTIGPRYQTTGHLPVLLFT